MINRNIYGPLNIFFAFSFLLDKILESLFLNHPIISIKKNQTNSCLGQVFLYMKIQWERPRKSVFERRGMLKFIGGSALLTTWKKHVFFPLCFRHKYHFVFFTLSTGIKPFECSECNKKFCSALSLQEHMSRHSNERPYICRDCHRSFRQVSCLRRHLLTHSTVMPHTCEMCGRKFSQAIYLRSHMKVHTGQCLILHVSVFVSVCMCVLWCEWWVWMCVIVTAQMCQCKCMCVHHIKIVCLCLYRSQCVYVSVCVCICLHACVRDCIIGYFAFLSHIFNLKNFLKDWLQLFQHFPVCLLLICTW